MPQTLAQRCAIARQTLEAIEQSHVLHFYDQLDNAGQSQLLGQIESIDWPEVARLIESHVKHKPTCELPENLQPAPWYPHQPAEDLKDKYDQARAVGEQLLADGQVAAFTVAGGQGTRLGWDGPKGTFPATPITGKPLFACFADYLLRAQQRYGKAIPYYLMTSPINDGPTRVFWEEHAYFGLDPDNVKIFPQAMMPALDRLTGKVLLAAKDSLALSPNGHGGSLKALHTSGSLTDMQQRGIVHISYTQVDNPIVRVVDPLFLGLHAIDQAQMSSKMLPKSEPLEKLGNFCLVQGKMSVIEYSDLPDEYAYETLDNGDLRFRAGSIAIHAIRVDFATSLNQGAFGLPFHRAEKKVPFVDEQGQTHQPDTPNAVKLETFVFDALPMCDHSIVYETDRADEFAPIKNADAPGAKDCPATSQQLQSDRAKTWLKAQGIQVDHRATIELSQRTAIYPDDLKNIDLPKTIGPDESVTL